MEDQAKTKAQLIEELSELREQVVEAGSEAEAKKQAEEALRLSGQLLEGTINASVDWLHIVDLDLRFVYASEPFQDLLARSGSDGHLIGERLDDVQQFLPQRILDEYRQVIDSKQTIETSETTVVCGRTYHTETHKCPILNEGQVTHVITIMRDITERKEKEEERIREKRFLDTALDTQLDTFFLFDPSTEKAVYWNKAFRDVSGYTDEEIGRMSAPSSYYSTDDLKRAEVFIEQTLQKKTGTIELELICKDGRKVLSEYRVGVILDDNGDPAHLVSIGRDITERKQAEEALQKERDFAESLVETANAIVLVLDPQGRIVRFNRHMEKLSGYQLAEVKGKDWLTTFLPGDERDRIGEILRQSLDDIQAHGNVNPIMTKDGHLRDIEWYDQALRDAHGEVVGVLAVGQDVTERRLLEERLRQSEKMEAIGQLAGGVAHDFNNQLGGIMNYADLLLSKTDDDELRPFIDGIIRLCTRSGELTNQLLAFSRKGKYQVVPVSIHQIVGEVVSMLGHSVDRRIQIRQRLDANPLTTTGDPTQLQNALLNLGLNARDAMPEGGELVFATGTVTLDEEHCCNSSFELVPGEYVRTKVSDSGTGMDEGTRSKIFEPFFTTKEQGKGTGMGLASVFGTVVNHHGAIEVESEIGKGTTMTVYLPLSREEPQEAKAGVHVAAQAAEGASARILIVDDDRSMRECTAEMLRHKGYGVVTCKDGAEAVDHYGKSWQHIDLVILDMNMPVMNGHDAFIAMREINAGIRAMLATGHSLDENAQKTMDEGTLSYIQKPFRMRELFAQVEQALGG